MKRRTWWIVLIVLGLSMTGLVADEATEATEEKQEGKRAKIDKVAQDTLKRLLDEPKAQTLFDKAHGYAVFSNLKVAIGVSGGGGTGVAVAKESGKRTYMKMGTAGIGLSLGGRKYQVVFLFQDEKTFDRFVSKGWQADTSANATAGTDSAGVAATFTNGLAIYVLTEKGLMASAEVAGTKYWKNDKLN